MITVNYKLRKIHGLNLGGKNDHFQGLGKR